MDLERIDDAQDHLLRTLAPVPVESRVLHLGCGSGALTERLVRLGFDVYACDHDSAKLTEARARLGDVFPSASLNDRIINANFTSLDYPADFFSWVVAHDVYQSAATEENVLEMFSETARVLQSGGWVHLTVRRYPKNDSELEAVDQTVFRSNGQVGAYFTTDRLTELMKLAGLAPAIDPLVVSQDGTERICTIYRNVDETTPP